MRYRIRTLLLFTFLAALVCLALRSPSRGWSASLFAALVVVILAAVLAAIYRTGATRAMAIGFCIFSLGYLLVEGRFFPGSGTPMTLPTEELISRSYAALHVDEEQLQSSLQFAADDPFAPSFPPPEFQHYKSICISTLAALFGLIGAAVAQQLERTRNSVGTSKQS